MSDATGATEDGSSMTVLDLSKSDESPAHGVVSEIRESFVRVDRLTIKGRGKIEASINTPESDDVEMLHPDIDCNEWTVTEVSVHHDHTSITLER